MPKLLNTTFLVTQSAPSTPSNNTGVLYATTTGRVFFTNSAGRTSDLTTIGSSSYIAYTTSGTYTYVTGSGIRYIKVVCIGGGGGGGTGNRTAANQNRNGGSGGAGGNINVVYFTSQSLTAGSYTVTVGGGGAGGPQNSGTGTGGVGQPGNPSSFASSSFNLVRAPGGPGGGGGGAGGSIGTGGTNLFPTTGSTGTINAWPPHYFAGCDGGGTQNGATLSVRGTALGGARWLAAGGAGAGINASNITSSGGFGSAIYNYATLIQSGSPGIVVGTNGDNGAPVIDIACLWFASGSGITTGIRIGTGGHGGAAGNGTSNSGRGGSGSLGAGGGGSGACLNTIGFVAPPGGKGGDGCVLIFEYY